MYLIIASGSAGEIAAVFYTSSPSRSAQSNQRNQVQIWE